MVFQHMSQGTSNILQLIDIDIARLVQIEAVECLFLEGLELIE
jgi:hypothetical protein